MPQAEDIEAIDRYIKGAKLHTSAAEKVHDEWVRFYDGLGWFGKTLDGEAYDTARNIRNRFNLANAKDAAARQRAADQMRTGLTAEEIAGGTRRALASGMYDEPLIGAGLRAGITVTALALGAVWGLKKLYIDPYL